MRLALGFCLFANVFGVGCTMPVQTNQLLANASLDTSKPQQHDFLIWHCTDDIVRQEVTDALTLHGTDVDLTQQYIENNLGSYFQQNGGVWLISISHIIRASDYIEEQVQNSPNFCLMYDNLSNVQAVVIRTNLW